jgi:hypothetical protein
MEREEYIKEKIEEIRGKKEVKIYIEKIVMQYTPFIVENIIKNIKEKEIKIINEINEINEEIDIIITHIIKNKKPITKKGINIVISGESDEQNAVEKFDYAITTIKNFNSINNIYVPQLFISLYEHKKSIEQKDYRNKKTRFCAYMYNNSIPLRVNILNMLNKYKKVDSLGKCSNNVKMKSTRFIYNNNETYNDIAVKIYSRYKFVLALENRICDGYFTEKIINPIIANSIPIYYGHSSVFEYINRKRVINLRDFSNIKNFLKYIEEIDNNDELYERIINEPIYNDNISSEMIIKKLEENISKIF